MKKVIAIFVLCAAGLAFAQSPSIAEPAPREHRGFYNSSSFGFALNWFKISSRCCKLSSPESIAAR